DMGVAHPPGYPLFLMLSKLFTLVLPFKTIAWRVNLFSAVCDALAAVILFRTVLLWTRSRLSGFLSVGLFAFSPLIWHYAVITEVFGLNNLFVALLCFLLVQIAKAESAALARRWLYRAAFVFGLGMTNQHTLVLVGLPMSGVALWSVLQRTNYKKGHLILLRVVGCYFLGLLPYLYLPLAAEHAPRIFWGDVSNFEGFFKHLLRKEYGTFRLALNGEAPDLLKGLGLYTQALFSESFFGAGMLLAIIGWVSFWRGNRWRVALFAMMLGFVVYCGVFHSLANLDLKSARSFEVQRRFWQESNFFVFLWAGLGFSVLHRRFRWAPLVGLVLILAQFGFNFRSENQSNAWAMEEFGRAMLNSLPEDAIVVSEGDDFTNPLRYVQMSEKVRPDVVILDRQLMKAPWFVPVVRKQFPQVEFPGLYYSWYDIFGAFGFKEFFEANISRHPIFLDYVSLLPSGDNLKPDDSWLSSFELLPHGYFLQVVKEGGSYDPEKLLRIHRIAKAGFEPPSLGETNIRKGSPQADLTVFSWDGDFLATTYVMHNLALKRTRSEGFYRASLNYLKEQVAQKEPLKDEPLHIPRNFCRIYMDWKLQYPEDFSLFRDEAKRVCLAFVEHPLAKDNPEAPVFRQMLQGL
ncbi:DUF2723 domain-containing protein, partial [Bdellovibrionota bacterium FG-2]